MHILAVLLALSCMRILLPHPTRISIHLRIGIAFIDTHYTRAFTVSLFYTFFVSSVPGKAKSHPGHRPAQARWCRATCVRDDDDCDRSSIIGQSEFFRTYSESALFVFAIRAPSLFFPVQVCRPGTSTTTPISLVIPRRIVGLFFAIGCMFFFFVFRRVRLDASTTQRPAPTVLSDPRCLQPRIVHQTLQSQPWP